MEQTVIEMNDVPALHSDGSTLLPPMKVKKRSKRCQCPVRSFITLAIVIIIGVGICMMMLHDAPSNKSLKPADEINVKTLDSEMDVMAESDLNKPLKRTHREDIFGMYNLTYLDGHNQINFDAFNQRVSDFVHTAKAIEESLTAYSQNQTMLRRELMRIIHQLEYDIKNCLEDLRNLQTSLLSTD